MVSHDYGRLRSLTQPSPVESLSNVVEKLTVHLDAQLREPDELRTAMEEETIASVMDDLRIDLEALRAEVSELDERKTDELFT